MGEYYIGLSISDLQQWLADDAISISVSRVFHSRVHLDDQAVEAYFDGLFRVLPPFALDDPAGVLIAEITGPATWGVDDEPAICNLHLNAVRRFIPLLSDARKVLAINWSETICLEEAIFEKRFLRFRLRRKKVAAIDAGLKFVSIFIDHGDIKFDVSDEYKSSLTRALMIADQLRSDEINEVLGKYAEKFKETWIDRLFGYTRHKRFDRAEDIKSFFDVGVILSETGATKSLIDDFRDICVRINRSGEPSLAEICSDPELLQFPVNFDISGMDSSKISVVTLGLFLRWKQKFHDDRSSVNAEAIFSDVCSIVGKVDVQVVSSALWMMGAYLGMEHVSPIYRLVHRNDYKALAFNGLENNIVPVPAWSTNRTESCEKQSFSAAEGGAPGAPENHHASLSSNGTDNDPSENDIAETARLDVANGGVESTSFEKSELNEIKDLPLSKTPKVQAEKFDSLSNPVEPGPSLVSEDGQSEDAGRTCGDVDSKPGEGQAKKSKVRGKASGKANENKGTKTRCSGAAKTNGSCGNDAAEKTETNAGSLASGSQLSLDGGNL